MTDRKAIKKSAQVQLKRHYILLVVLCAVSIFLGTEFNNVVSNAQLWYDWLTGQEATVDTDDFKGEMSARQKIADDLIQDNLEAGRPEVAASLEAGQDGSEPNPMLARQKGVLAALVNNIGSGRLTSTLAAALHSIAHSRQLSDTLMTVGSLIFYAAVWIFLRNFYQAVLRRAFLETRTYDKLPMSHLLHFAMVKRWAKVSLTLLVKSAYEALWTLTIVGGFIKHYSYFLTPWIAAENPDIGPNQAVTLSRRMMNGHKWECCKLELSFILWLALSFVTFGAVDVLWCTPYRVAAFTEYYARLRAEARAAGLEGADLLNDDWLYERADGALLRERYADVLRREDLVDEDIVELSPRHRFFARNFGIWAGSLDEKTIYSRQAGLRQQLRLGRMELRGEAYPERLNALWNHRTAALTGRVSYLAPCTVWTLVVVFFAFCMVGWIWEVSLHLMTHGQFVNRGTLHGPWLPIYGSGVAMIAVLLYRFRTRPALEAAAIVVLCGFVEYMTSWVLELVKGMRWWDYTGYFLNLNGRICAEGLAVFAIGGMAAVYLLVPLIDSLLAHVKPKLLVAVCVLLLAIFTADLIYSQRVPNAGAGITDDPEVAAAAVIETGDPA